ncbi:MAG: hypothetical protein KDJ35_01405 [Alphaproteobacteria bacterium]|nr:hypothetical protein [Alphaproteobacteria bacterium]
MRMTKFGYLELCFTAALALNVLVWFYARDISARWLNVPPVPSSVSASGAALGDQQFAYRSIGIMLQNLGDTGGRSTPLKNYDYKRLSGWFNLMDTLDPQARFAPFLAAFYFGVVEAPEKLPPLVDYLAMVGQRSGVENWRWLAHAIFIVRWQMHDLDKALALSYKLAALNEPDLPLWARQMPVFVLNAKGDKAEAKSMMLQILQTSADTMNPNELNFTKDYICSRLLDAQQAAQTALCSSQK